MKKVHSKKRAQTLITVTFFLLAVCFYGPSTTTAAPFGSEVTVDFPMSKIEDTKKDLKKTHLSWEIAEEILTHISDPKFPDLAVNIIDFGAVPNDGKLDTAAIQEAINQVSNQGGGYVIVPSGIFDTGAIELKNNVNLCLRDVQSTLRFTKEINHRNYPLVYAHYEGSELYNWSPFIYAYGKTNIALTGKGTLDGQADAETWWNWRSTIDNKGNIVNLSSPDAKALRAMTDKGTPAEERIFGEGHYLRPNFLQPIRCTNVLIEGITVKNSPMWLLNPVLCTNFTARNVTLDSHGYNNDGIDPENSNYVLIEDCHFNTGDDCIAVKAGRNLDGRKLEEAGFPTQNLIIRNNTFADGHGGIALGSEMSGSIYNLFADNNVFDSSHLNYALRFKTNAERGGVIRNVYLRNSTVKSVGNAVVHATMLYDVGPDGKYLPSFENIRIENLTSTGGQYGIFMEAFNEVPITGLELVNIEITGAQNEIRALNWKNPLLQNVTINGKRYPRPIDTKILGIPQSEVTVSGSSVLLGGDNNNLSFEWKIADTQDAIFTPIAKGETFTIPKDASGKYLKLIAADSQGNIDESISYKVLKRNHVAGIEAGHPLYPTLQKAASKGYIDENKPLDLNRPVTNRDVAVILAKLWNLSAPNEKVEITDLPTNDPDYEIIAAVIEAKMMNLKDPDINTAQGTLYNAGITKALAAKRTAFLPSAIVSREEMGYIAILSCGVPYNETLGTKPKYTDAKEIAPAYSSNVGASSYFGFMTAKDKHYFMPKDPTTMGELISVITAISDFANL